MAKAQQMIWDATYDAATVKLLGQVFDDAWAVVAPKYSSPLTIEAERLKLANIVLNLAATGERDPTVLTDKAVRTLTVDDP
jgi:hypothetical protein